MAIKSRKRKHKSKINKPILLVAVFILSVVFFSFFEYEGASSAKKPSKNAAKIVVKSKPSPTKIPSPTVTLSPTTTPTPTVSTQSNKEYANSGFCLNVPTLMYHHVQPYSIAKEKGQTSFTVDSATFEQQMSYIASSGYTTITPSQLIDALKNHSSLPSKPILVTLDDGYKDIYLYAFPIFKKYNIKAALMIPSGLVGGADYLSWSDIEDMGKSGLISYTDHTWSHYAVNRGTEEKIKYEIETSRQQLQEHTGQKIDIFAYPYGSFSPTSISILQADGFSGAFSTLPGTYQCDSFIMTLHRTRIGNASLSYYGL